MYKQNKQQTTQFNVNTSYLGETIEQKIRRVLNNREPITDGSPIIYTERNDGVLPELNIRTDRFDLAIEATDYIHKGHLAKRDERHNPPAETGKETGGQSIQATESK